MKQHQGLLQTRCKSIEIRCKLTLVTVGFRLLEDGKGRDALEGAYLSCPKLSEDVLLAYDLRSGSWPLEPVSTTCDFQVEAASLYCRTNTWLRGTPFFDASLFEICTSDWQLSTISNPVSKTTVEVNPESKYVVQQRNHR